MLSAEQNHKVDASVHYNLPELQSSSRLPAPQHNGQQEPPASRKGPLVQEMDPDSEEEEDGEDDDEDPPRRKWQGIEAILEAYQEHVEGTEGRGGRPGSREECARRLSGLMMRAGFHRQAGDCLSHKAQGSWATSRQEPQNRSLGFWGAWASLQQPFLTDRHPPWRNLGAERLPHPA